LLEAFCFGLQLSDLFFEEFDFLAYFGLAGISLFQTHESAMLLDYALDHLDRNSAVHRSRGIFGILRVIHEFLDRHAWEADFHGNPRPDSVSGAAISTLVGLGGERKTIRTGDPFESPEVSTLVKVIRRILKVKIEIHHFSFRLSNASIGYNNFITLLPHTLSPLSGL